MLEYTKTILQKVSFDQNLFKKELRKSIKWLRKEEALTLYTWCMITFGDTYGEMIRDIFKNM